jgi:chemotaxis methyl-accepting protein methylase
MTTRDQAYALIESLVTSRTGVDIAGHLAGRVRAHVDARVAALAMGGPEDYLAALEARQAGADAMLDDLLAAVLVHETFFMRFRSQLQVL